MKNTNNNKSRPVTVSFCNENKVTEFNFISRIVRDIQYIFCLQIKNTVFSLSTRVIFVSLKYPLVIITIPRHGRISILVADINNSDKYFVRSINHRNRSAPPLGIE